jgi:hypothetical protein
MNVEEIKAMMDARETTPEGLLEYVANMDGSMKKWLTLPPPKWKKDMTKREKKRFAQWYLTLLTPWGPHNEAKSPDDFTYAMFEQFIHDLRQGTTVKATSQLRSITKLAGLSNSSTLTTESTLTAAVPSHVCALPQCENSATARCARCKLIFYCCKEHQVEHWPVHKTTASCAKFKKKKIKKKMATSRPSWHSNMSPPDIYEWFTNCYQLRCDDDYVYGGCYLHGPYNPEATRSSFIKDFMVYCLLAKRKKIIPKDWDWSAFLQVAKRKAGYGLEKSDAEKRWGPTKFFAVALLKTVASEVYGSSAHEFEDPSDADQQILDQAEEDVQEGWRAASVEVGGKAAWEEFSENVTGNVGGDDESFSDDGDDVE